MLRIIWQPFYTLWVLLTFVTSLLIAFPFFLALSILKDGPEARKAITQIVKVWSRGWLLSIGMPIIVKGVKPGAEQYVVVANHISYLDTVNIYAAIPGYFRTLAKKEMAKIPVFGFVYKRLAILVDRSSAHSRSVSMRLMWKIIRTEASIAIFPEGTFNETGAPMKDLYDGAFRLAISSNTPILPLLFPDTVKRWHYSAWWKVSPGKNRAIFLAPVPVDGLTVKDLPELREKVKQLMGDCLVKYP